LKSGDFRPLCFLDRNIIPHYLSDKLFYCLDIFLTAKEMKNITTNFRLGFGGFVDKPRAPYIDTEPGR